MINFDANSIYNRLLEKLQQDPNWKVISRNSVVSSLIRSTAEVNAETARYAEYLFKESKWDTAQNLSSILSMANMLGYRPKRKISATGKIYVSVDPRTHLVGRTISADTFKDLNDKNTLNWGTPYTDLSINSNNTIIDSKGNSYVALDTIYRSGMPYRVVNIIQGKRRTLFIDIDTIRSTLTLSKIDPYLYVPAKITACEDASNTSSKGFFRVYVTKLAGDGSRVYEEYRVVDSLLLSTSSDRDVEVYNDPYNRELFYFKFNNDPQRGTTLDISQNTSIIGIRVDYLESRGSAGNLLNAFETFTISGVNPTGSSTVTSRLYGINFDALLGGKDEEDIASIKVNAPKYYISNYSAGTKEAYEKTIANLELPITVGTTSEILRPSKVQVYGGTQKTENNLSQTVTCVSFLASQLEDIVNTTKSGEVYTQIETTLNSYLSRLKSPQDTIVFRAPNYVSFAIGLTCTLDKKGDNLDTIVQNIRNDVDTLWGSNSEELDFNRSFYPSEIIANLKNKYSSIKGLDVEIEAIKKLDWSVAERMDPSVDQESSVNTIHTCRIPFSFSNIFYGNSSIEGFKDHRSGADYVMRVDFMYRKPNTMATGMSYHTSLFIQESSGRRSTDAFYVINDANSNNAIWNTAPESESDSTPKIVKNTQYQQLINASPLSTTWQFRYKDKVYSDDQFRQLIEDTSSTQSTTLRTYLIDRGAIDDYLIYFSSNYDKSGEYIGNGFIELTFDPIYRMLATFASYDANLKADMQGLSLSQLKCGNLTSENNIFTQFRDIVAKYVDIYVCMRPYDKNLVINADSSGSVSQTRNNLVLYIDSADSASTTDTGTITNLTADKRPRMISVTCKYENED
jgi:hypothetical protein|nr:MAG TPA_asm: baseplate wedge protein [Caudoviricetes sp.]